MAASFSFLGPHQVLARTRRAGRLSSSPPSGRPRASRQDDGEAGESAEGIDGEALSAVEKLMSSERGEKLNKAMREVIFLKAAKDALQAESSPAAAADRRRIERLREESLEELQSRLEDVERAKRELDTVNAQQQELASLLEESAERIESLKSAAAGAAAGGLFTLPLLVSHLDILALGSATLSSALFALVYRYAITNDVSNTQLKSGVVLAFGLTRGLSDLSLSEERIGETSSLIDQVVRSALRGDIVVHTFQSLLLFAFVSAVLEYGFKANLLSLFGGNAGRSE